MEKADSSVQKLSQTAGEPVFVKPVVLKDDMGDADLGMKMVVGPDDIKLQKKEVNGGQKTNLAQVENPVVNPPFNNWSVNQPSPPHQRGYAGTADYGQNYIIDGSPVHW